MIQRLLAFSLRRRELVLFAVVGLLSAGLWSGSQIPIDAVPDITSPMVQVNTAVPGLAPEEIEKLVTFPLEIELSGIPGMETMRSLSKFGLSQITMIFRDGTDIYRSRQLVSERLLTASAKLPRDLTPTLAPMATGLGEILYYTLGYRPDAKEKPPTEMLQLMELRLIQEYTVKPLLRMVPGVADVNTSGGYQKLVLIEPDPESLFHAGITASELASLVGKNVENVGGAVIDQAGQQLFVRSLGRVEDLPQIERLPVKYGGSAKPILVGDLARVSVGPNIRTGAATYNGEETVLGTVLMLVGENASKVAERAKAKMAEIQARLPPGVELRIVYDQSDLVNRTIHTVIRNLSEGALLVTGVLFFLIANVRASLLVASVIPLSFLFAITLMRPFHVSANLMSLGAIDFGLLVDGAVVIVENTIREIARRQTQLGRPLTSAERHSAFLASAEQVGPSVFFGVLVIGVVYFPILALGGIEGKMFRPMALTVILALSGSLLLALSYVPAMGLLWLGKGLQDRESHLIRWVRALYTPALRWSLGRGGPIVVLLSFSLFAYSLYSLSRMGAVFVPRLNEGSFTVMVYKAWSMGLPASMALEKETEKMLLSRVPEISLVFSRAGTPDIATDPMPQNENDTYLILRPPEEWREEGGRPISRDRLIEIIQSEIAMRVPGQGTLFGQPIEMRFNEMLEGEKADLSAKWYGPDFDVLEPLAEKTSEVLRKIPGAIDVQMQSAGRSPSLEFVPDRAAMDRYTVEAGEINAAVATSMAGQTVGTMIDGERRYPVVVRLPETLRSDPNAILHLPVRSESGGLLPLGEVGRSSVENRVRIIHRSGGIRYQPVQVTLGSRDVAGFVREAQNRISRSIQIPPGYYLEFGGQYQNLLRAQARLALIVPAALILIFFLIYTALGKFRQTFLVLLSVPVAITGGVFALQIAGLPFSLSAAVGFIALSGIAVLAALVLVSFLNQLREEGRGVGEAVWEGCQIRLRPIFMTATVASLGFLPMVLARGAGAEVQRPLATVVIGGILSSTLLSLLLLPTLYSWMEQWHERSEAGKSRLAGRAPQSHRGAKTPRSPEG
ncbi:MAG: efflux RND transporter permease subunit [Candidatus Methylacidiphilaceae bacterium]